MTGAPPNGSRRRLPGRAVATGLVVLIAVVFAIVMIRWWQQNPPRRGPVPSGPDGAVEAAHRDAGADPATE